MLLSLKSYFAMRGFFIEGFHKAGIFLAGVEFGVYLFPQAVGPH